MNTLQTIISQQMLEESITLLKELLPAEKNSLASTFKDGLTDYHSKTSAASRFYEDTVGNGELILDKDGVKLDMYIVQNETKEVLFLAYTHQNGSSSLAVSSEAFPSPLLVEVSELPPLQELDDVLCRLSA